MTGIYIVINVIFFIISNYGSLNFWQNIAFENIIVCIKCNNILYKSFKSPTAMNSIFELQQNNKNCYSTFILYLISFKCL